MMAVVYLILIVLFLIMKGDVVLIGIFLFIAYCANQIRENYRESANRALKNHYLKRDNNRNNQQQNAVNDSVAKQKPNEEQLEDLAEERAEEYAEDYYNYLHEGNEDAPDFEYDGCVSRRDIPDMLNEIEERYEEEREKREDW